jgi:hypothetical protein
MYHRGLDRSAKHRLSLTVRRLSLAECTSVETPMVHCVYHKKLTLKTYQISRQICDIASVRTARGKVSWIATWTRPDAAFAMGRLSQITPENINSEATKSCNDLNDYLTKTVKRNLIFCKLDVKSLHVVFYSDTSFAGNLDLSSQIGGIILLKDKNGNAHVLHWFSKKCPRATGSVLAAEIIAFVTAFDMASALRDVLEEIYQQSIPLYGLADSYTFFSTVTQYNALREKRLSIPSLLLYARPTRSSSLPIWGL